MPTMTKDQRLIDAPPYFSDIGEYMGRFADRFAGRVDKRIECHYRPGADEMSPAVAALALEKFRPFPAQAVAVEAIRRTFLKQRIVWLVGEMGTGKTAMGCWAIRALSHNLGRPLRVVISAPNQLTEKWARHARDLVPGARVQIVRSWTDFSRMANECRPVHKHKPGAGCPDVVNRWMDPDRHQIWIMPRDRGKLGYPWRVAVKVRRREVEIPVAGGDVTVGIVETWHCPRCGEAILTDNGDAAGKEYFFGKRGDRSQKRKCQACHEPLWQAFNGRPGEHGLPVPGIFTHRMSPAEYIRHLGIRLDLYISDEVHELKGATSLQGQMYANLCAASSYVLNMTGTLTGGYADNLLHLLWRSRPSALVNDGLQHTAAGFEAFVERYGVLETIAKYDGGATADSGTKTMGRTKKMSRRVKSCPGISPKFFAWHMLDQSVFIRLQDMHSHLPNNGAGPEERLHVVPMAPEQDMVMAMLQQQYQDHVRSMGGKSRAWSAARAAFLRWPDKPWVDSYPVLDYDDFGVPFTAFTVPSLPKREYPKERRLRRIIQRNKLRGRKTWLFTELAGLGRTPEWDVMEYLVEYLGQYGIRARVLRSQAQGGPKPDEREQWIADNSSDIDVMISNPSLVQTGLDLYDFPSIVFAYTGDKTYVLRQASRRHYRLGQHHNCEVDYLVYNGKKSKSIQKAAMSLMATKMGASLALEGDLSSTGLASMADGEDISSQLARYIAGQLEVRDVGDSFDEYRNRMAECVARAAEEAATFLGLDKDSQLSAFNGPVVQPTATPEPAEPRPMEPEQPAATVAETKQPPAPKPAPPRESVVARFERATTINGQEPSSIGERKRMRLRALEAALGSKAVEISGDRCLIESTWYHLVAKHRSTVRARNFEATASDYPTAVIAFVEPRQEAGPTTSTAHQSVDGVDYVVSFLPISEYMAGERTARGL